MLGVDPLVTFGEQIPVPAESLLRLRVLPQIQFLGRRIHAVAGSAMEVQADVQPVLLPQVDHLIDASSISSLTLYQSSRFHPQLVGHGQSDEVESPVLQPAEVVFHRLRIVTPGEEVGQIEPALPWQYVLRRWLCFLICSSCHVPAEHTC